MRDVWDRLIESPKALVVAGVTAVVVVGVAIALVVLPGDDDLPEQTAPTAPAAATGSAPTASSTPEPEAEVQPPDKDEYCPAFRTITSGGLGGVVPEREDEGVDLATLSTTFATLIKRYEAAEAVSPLSLRDDYARALGYLREGKKAVDSGDVELLKGLVVNLETLNDSMTSIQTRSAQFCD